MRIVALIPARAGSRRIPRKNTKPLGGKPLIQWTIEAAQESGIFADIAVYTDDYSLVHWLFENSSVPAVSRSVKSAEDAAPDILWVVEALFGKHLLDVGPFDAFAILRPTSPFRSGGMIRDAWEYFLAQQPADSLRTVRPVTEHPGKVWMCQREQRIVPLLPYWTRTGDKERDTPWHSTPTQNLPVMHVQTGGLEIAWVKTVRNTGTIAGTNVIPYTPAEEIARLDINYPEDWARAEQIVAALQAPPAA